MTDAFTHGSAKLSSGVRLHHVTADTGPATIVLLLGYPQTRWKWRHVIGPLAEAGLRVVAPDHRGAGQRRSQIFRAHRATHARRGWPRTCA